MCFWCSEISHLVEERLNSEVLTSKISINIPEKITINMGEASCRLPNAIYTIPAKEENTVYIELPLRDINWQRVLFSAWQRETRHFKTDC